MSEKRGLFLKHFFKNVKTTGSVTPSSRFLVAKLCNMGDFEHARYVVELGPGTGVFTQEILSRVSDATRVIAIESNEDFVHRLNERFDDVRLTVIHGDAAMIKDIVSGHWQDEVDIVLSSLPLTVIPEPAKSRIMNGSFEVLRKGGEYLQYQYSMNAANKLKTLYGNLQVKREPRNVPPARCFRCVK